MWPSPLTHDLEILWVSSGCRGTRFCRISSKWVPRFMSYRINSFFVLPRNGKESKNPALWLDLWPWNLLWFKRLSWSQWKNSEENNTIVINTDKNRNIPILCMWSCGYSTIESLSASIFTSKQLSPVSAKNIAEVPTSWKMCRYTTLQNIIFEK